MKPSAHFHGSITTVSGYQANDLVHSELTQFDSAKSDAALFGIKYVAAGKERYIMGNSTYEIEQGQYLLINKGQSYECNFKSNRPVHGICIGLNEEILAGIYRDLCQPDENLLDDPHSNAPSFDGFHQLVYSGGNKLGIFMRTLSEKVRSNSIKQTATPYDLFYDICVQLLHSHSDTSEKMSKIKARRQSTKKELYARLEGAKHMLEQNLDQPLRISAVASSAALSEFHFYRSFKTVYGITPHQYLLRRKINRSAELIEAGNHSMTEIAYEVGFNDIHSFSKAFSHHFGLSPSKWNTYGIKERLCEKLTA